MSDTWPIVHAERRALVEDLTQLTNAQWEQPSLCEGWSVHDVARQVGLHATDADFSTSDGPEVTGPALSLLMVISGRTVAIDDLDGPGVAVLR